MNPRETKLRLLLKQSLDRIRELQARLKETDPQAPIAIIGMGCRMPGGVDAPDELWRLLGEERDVIRTVPEDRWSLPPLTSADGPMARAGRWAGFLESVDTFDAAFFGISPREARVLDPQHRLALTVTWEALEHAGVQPSALMGSDAGVFLGLSTHDYRERVLGLAEDEWDAYAYTGNHGCLAAGRIAYVLGAEGPALTIDTACSSSLSAVHLAVQSLRRGECTLALAGGVSIICSSDMMTVGTRLQALSPSGRCRSFDACADGFVRGEGAGMIVLKRLDAAQRDGDRIWAVIRGSAMNQDGRSTGLTAPNGQAQERLLRSALEDATTAAEELGYIEAHGTGTPVGDPIELSAIKSVFGAPRRDALQCRVGSIKATIGHLEAAAGIAGLLKVVLALHHARVPRHLNFEVLNPRISLAGTPLAVAERATDWGPGDTRVAGVSSFGLSGTNVHVVLASAPKPAPTPLPTPTSTHYLLPMSSRDGEGLARLTERWAGWLAHSDTPLADIVHTATRHREHHEHRLTVVGTSAADLADRLRDAADTGRVQGTARSPKIALVFPGQGAQWAGAMRRLLGTAPAFDDALAACDAAVRQVGGWSLTEALADPDARWLDRIDRVQPVLWGLQVALAALWRDWGITPAALVGHSMGEVAAGVVSGALSTEDGARIICLRSQLLTRIAGQGQMAVVGLSVSEAQTAIGDHRHGTVAVAVSNSPDSTVLSGAPQAVDEILSELTERGIFCRPVKVDVASHSPQVDPLLAELRQILQPVRPRAGTVPLCSTVDVDMTDGASWSADYWVRNLREPVRFGDAIVQLRAQGVTHFVEVSTHPVLLPVLQRGLADAPDCRALASVRRDRSERAQLLDTLGALYCDGAPVQWDHVHPAGAVVPLPTYPWRRDRFWLEANAGPNVGATRGASGHPLLGPRLHSALDDQTVFWQSRIDPARLVRLQQHRIAGHPLVPAAALIDIALAAAADWLGHGQVSLEDVELAEAWWLEDQAPVTLQISLKPHDAGARLTVSTRTPESDWRHHLRARCGGHDETPPTVPDLPHTVQDTKGLYSHLHALGFGYGEAFQTVEGIHEADARTFARLRMVQPTALGWGLDPTLLDGALQAICAPTLRDSRAPAMPVGFRRITAWSRDGGPLRWAIADGEAAPGGCLLNAQGQQVLHIEGVELQALSNMGAADEPWLRVRWMAAPVQDGPQPKRVLLWGGPPGFAAALAAALRPASIEVLVAPEPGDQDAADAIATACDGAPPDLVVHLSALLDSVDPFSWQRPLSATLHLVQGVVAQPWRDRPRVVCVTRGAQAVTAGEPCAPGQAAIWGLTLTAAYELPELQFTRIDLPPGDGADDAQALATELLRGAGAGQVALRGERRLTPQVEPAQVPPARAPTLRKDGTYLVTGGLGDLGLELAQWLAEHGAGCLALVGRSGASTPAQRSAIQALEAQGVQVEVGAVDIADPTTLADWLTAMSDRAHPLRGVFHLAAVLDDGLLLNMDARQLNRPMLPKLVGAQVLHELTLKAPLDHFVVFSSAAAVLGSPGQANYAAANAAVDALCRWRHSQGLPASSVAWGPFSQVGLAAAQDDRGGRLAQRGLPSLTPAEGLTLLPHAMQHGEPTITAAPFDVHRWTQFHPQVAAWPYFDTLRARSTAPAQHAGVTFRESVAAALPGERQRVVRDLVRGQLALVLRTKPEQIGDDTPLKNLGVDSLMGLELRNRLEPMAERQLPATLAWTWPTVTAIADFLLDGLGPIDPSTTEDHPHEEDPEDPPLQDALDSMSEQEKQALLLEKLAALEHLL